MSREKIIAKIQKLLALGRSTNEHEARLAMERASQLMQEHQVSMSEAEVNEVRGQTIEEEEYVVAGQRLKVHWLDWLGQSAAKLFDGDLISFRNLHCQNFKFVGYKEDIQAMKAMFEHLHESWKSIVEHDLRMAKEERKGRFGTNFTPKETMAFKHGHGIAYSTRVYQRVMEIVEARKAAVSQTTTGTALVVVKDQALTDHIRKRGYVSRRTRSSLGSEDGRVAGDAAGRRAALGEAVQAGGGNLKIGG